MLMKEFPDNYERFALLVAKLYPTFHIISFTVPAFLAFHLVMRKFLTQVL